VWRLDMAVTETGYLALIWATYLTVTPAACEDPTMFSGLDDQNMFKSKPRWYLSLACRRIHHNLASSRQRLEVPKRYRRSANAR
jgi:hypothetical protein